MLREPEGEPVGDRVPPGLRDSDAVVEDEALTRGEGLAVPLPLGEGESEGELDCVGVAVGVAETEE